MARISGEGLGPGNRRGLVNPEYVFPDSVFTSMFAAKINPFIGPRRSPSTTNSAMAIVPPGTRAAWIHRSSALERSTPSL
jgi:hypothetical protein